MGKLVKILIPATILLIPAYLIRFEIFGIPTNVLEILVLACLVLAVFGRINRTDRTNGTYFLAIALIFVGLLVSTLVNDNWRAGFGIIKGWFAVPLVFGWALRREIRGIREIREVLKWLYSGVVLAAAISLVYYFLGDLTYDGRLKAFYLSPNHLAMYLAPGIIIGSYFLKEIISPSNKSISISNPWQMMSQLAYASRRYKLLFFIISFFMVAICFYFTYSYAAWTAVILSLIVTVIIKNKKVNKRAVLIGLMISLLIFISQWNSEKLANLKNFSRSSLESRIMIWQSAVKILKDNPVWGIGPGNFQEKYLEYQQYFPPYLEWAAPQPHNLYLAFWLQAGIIGLAGFITLTLQWLNNLIAFIQKQKNSADIAAVLLAIMIYILIHGLIDAPYWKNDLAMVFWIIIVLGIMAKNLETDAV